MSKSAYYEHYSKYFDITTRTWQHLQVFRRQRESDFDFNSECHEKSIMETEALNVGESGDECYDVIESDDCCMAEDDHFESV